ncbi:RNA polymerase sigma factor [Anaerobacillus alkaliphilus]|uniref:RNA polymerase sigma factor n=1 Tax=Anaerobacillus alkaliphilus TaxID=1548597 RepID=UPI001F4FD428|nr:RNA polymerase sigma factor [Anaerobacillus alkaliphilus]
MEEGLKKERLHEWYHFYSEDIYRFILMMLGDDEQAKDLTHDTFIKAYNSMDLFKGDVNDKNWLYFIARNITIDYMRKRKPILFMIDSFSAVISKNHIPDNIALLGEREEQLYCSLRKLKRSYRELIILRKIKELSIRETAEVLNWSEGKVKVTLHRALLALKNQMEKEGFYYETI